MCTDLCDCGSHRKREVSATRLVLRKTCSKFPYDYTIENGQKGDLLYTIGIAYPSSIWPCNLYSLISSFVRMSTSYVRPTGRNREKIQR